MLYRTADCSPFTPSHSPLDTGNNGVRVRPLLGSVIVLLDDNDLLAGLTARENDGNLSGLVD